jgi:toxin ParE1/3/4
MDVRWTLQALRDREQILEYSKDFSPRAAVRADDQIELQTNNLKRFPKMGRPGRFAGTRELVILHTRCIAVYRVAEDGVVILRVFYGTQQSPNTLDLA